MKTTAKPHTAEHTPVSPIDTKGQHASAGPPARVTARNTRAEIGDIMAGVSLNGVSTQLDRRGATDKGSPKHPIGSGIAFERVEDVYRMDPSKIILEGPYVRQFLEDAAFHQLREAVAQERDIGQHLGVRIVGPPTDQRRVLVYGMRRWKAALAEGLEKVPVRDYGPITVDRAVELQMLENEIRADPHPVDTALGFYLLSQQDAWNQKRIAQVFDKNKGYVSEMARVGEALALLDDATRAQLYAAPAVTVRAFQSIAQVKDVNERGAAIAALLASAMAAPARDSGSEAVAFSGTTPRDVADTDALESAQTTNSDSIGRAQQERRRTVDDAVFHVRPLRNGRSFRVRWTDDDLRRDGARIAAEFKERFLEEYTHLLHRSTVLAGQGSGPTVDIAAVVAEAAKGAARVDSRLAQLGVAVGKSGASALSRTASTDERPDTPSNV